MKMSIKINKLIKDSPCSITAILVFLLFFVNTNLDAQIPGFKNDRELLKRQNTVLESEIVTLQLKTLKLDSPIGKLYTVKESYIVTIGQKSIETLAYQDDEEK